MPVHSNHKIEELVVTLTSGAGVVIRREQVADPLLAAGLVVKIISTRGRLDAGDIIHITRTVAGEIHQPRETD